MLDGIEMPTAATTSKEELVRYYRTMYTTRAWRWDVLYEGKFIKGFCHLYDGQEAVGMGSRPPRNTTTDRHLLPRPHLPVHPRRHRQERPRRADGQVPGPPRAGRLDAHVRGAQQLLRGTASSARRDPSARASPSRTSTATTAASRTPSTSGAANQRQLFEAINMAALEAAVHLRVREQQVRDGHVDGARLVRHRLLPPRPVHPRPASTA